LGIDRSEIKTEGAFYRVNISAQINRTTGTFNGARAGQGDLGPSQIILQMQLGVGK